MKTLYNHERAQNIGITSDGIIMTTGSDKRLKFYSLLDDSILKETYIRSYREVLAVSPCNKFVLAGYHKLGIWEIYNFKKIATLVGHKHDINSYAFSNDSKMVATASGEFRSPEDYTLRIWDTFKGVEL